MATPAQLQAAATAAIQAEAAADYALIQAFIAANGTTFNTILANITALAGNMASTARQATVTQLGAELQQCKNDFLTLQSTTNAAQTTTPVA